jgi:hypothetical protein
MPQLRPGHALAFGVAAAAGILFYAAHNASGGSRPPRMQNTTESLYTVPDPVNPVQPDIGAGYVFTQHRYPFRCGHEITTLIQGGHSAASVPKWLADDAYWIVKPPTELVL